MVVEGERFLQALKFVWDDHSASMNQLTQVLRYMVRRLLTTVHPHDPS
jgi:hypothetical protein